MTVIFFNNLTRQICHFRFELELNSPIIIFSLNIIIYTFTKLIDCTPINNTLIITITINNYYLFHYLKIFCCHI